MSPLLCIATDYLTCFLNKVEGTSLKKYLRYANTYTGSRIKSKNQLIEMIIYGFMCDKINDIPSIEVSDKYKFKKIIAKCNIDIKKLHGYGNCNKRKEGLINQKLCVKTNSKLLCVCKNATTHSDYYVYVKMQPLIANYGTYVKSSFLFRYLTLLILHLLNLLYLH